MIERRDGSSLIWGIVLVALGLMFLFGNFGYGWWFGGMRWWPVLLIALGVWMLYQQREGAGPATAPPASPPAPPAPGTAEPGSPPPAPAAAGRRYPTGAIILIGIGVAFLLDDVIGRGSFPAIVLIAIGLALFLRDRRRP